MRNQLSPNPREETPQITRLRVKKLRAYSLPKKGVCFRCEKPEHMIHYCPNIREKNDKVARVYAVVRPEAQYDNQVVTCTIYIMWLPYLIPEQHIPLFPLNL